MDTHPRVLRYFLVVAEERHFRRAAERLYITGPALSQQIKQLESTLGVELFRRTSRSVELTAHGEELVPLARSVVEGSDAIGAWAAATKTRKNRLRVGFMSTAAGDLTQRILASAQASPRGFDVELHQLDWDDQTRAVTDGRVDAAFVREPVATEGIRCTPVFAEPRVAMLPAGHRLAGRDSIMFADIAGEVFMPSAIGSRAWIDYWLVEPRPDCRPVRRGPTVSSVEEMLENCAGGRGIAITAGSVPKFYAHPQVRFVPVDDLSPNHVVLAVAADDARTVVADFERLVATVARAAGPGDR
ncbi:LysR family transcriptional regulator [Gordonia amarae]|uniref:LysR family transcriptional regulator n=2 Tax=Gordonia amarae TaxID=36821 RepID=A0A857MAM5_9ACTN|nr:LysR substrate-binding domain-containing protein [Gordonia amarae]MCS3878678.1 DNA-binding transcriptional LysR family regulator [Gordonia amarae]QHN17269.1 LysR family transcriptional regulator [Gordonia amarae]QHN21795.1 LysR family transcriptional regulator [Gordonia amarae]QHN30646.1 LysR family transcriptional regulator [Gordonia amarae]QHN39423.1 LysR family transcriptional regulator [Gordonia amarae]